MVHLGIIPDGNRRWCKTNDMSSIDLPNIWEKNFKDRILECIEARNDKSKYSFLKKITEISMYVCSIDNVNRSDGTQKIICDTLFRVCKIFLNPQLLFEPKYLNDVNELMKDMQLNIVGDISTLPIELQDNLNKVKEKCNGIFKINLAIVYNYNDDLLNFASNSNPFYTRDQTDIDIIFRSGGEQRISGFFPTKIIYSELYFTKVLWPDVTLYDIKKCLKYFFKRTRRFGK